MEFWTLEHFLAIVPAFIVGLIIAILLRKFLINKPLYIRMIPFQVCTGLLLFLEVLKQIDSFEETGYRLYSIPLHVCSLFLFLFPLMSFYKGKHSDLINTFACTVSGALTIFMVVLPTIIFSADNVKYWDKDFMSLHTVFFHNLVLFMFVLILALELHTPQKKSYLKEILIGAGIYSVIAALFSQLLKTNFSNFYECNIGPLKDLVDSIKASLGYGAGQAIYVFVLILLHIGFFILSYYVYRLVQKAVSALVNLKTKKSTETVEVEEIE